MNIFRKIVVGILVFAFLGSGCSSGKSLTVPQLKEGQAVKLVFLDGRSENVFIVGRTGNEINYVSEVDHSFHSIPFKNIRRVERLNVIYDDLAYPISQAEIEKYKTNKNVWIFGIGGAVIGSAVGLAVSLPFWLKGIGDVPPYFVAGAGAVIGSVFYTFRGQEKDRELAVQKIRYIRKTDRELQRQLEEEKAKLEAIKKEKKELEQKVKKNK